MQTTVKKKQFAMPAYKRNNSSNIKRNLKSERKNTQASTSLFIYAVSKYQYDSERGVHGPIETKTLLKKATKTAKPQ